MDEKLMFVAALSVVAFGCERRTPPPTSDNSTVQATAEPVGGGPMLNDMVTVTAATDRMAEAACSALLKCDQSASTVSAGLPEDCLEKHKTVARTDLTPTTCPKGVDSSRLTACVERVTSSSCDDLPSALVALDECRSSALCVP